MGIISAQLFRRIADCRLPLLVGPSAAKEFFETLTIASGQRHQKTCRKWTPDVRNVVNLGERLNGIEAARADVLLGNMREQMSAPVRSFAMKQAIYNRNSPTTN